MPSLAEDLKRLATAGPVQQRYNSVERAFQIYAYLSYSRYGKTLEDIQDELSGSVCQRTIRRYLDIMIKQGFVTKDGVKYAANNVGVQNRRTR